MITAAKAYVKALCRQSHEVAAELDVIERQIRTCLPYGVMTTTLHNYPLLPEVVNILHEYGYKVEEGLSYVTISWDKENKDG